jgi:thiamine-monophosphate kinase
MVQRLEDTGEFGLIKRIRGLIEREGIHAKGVTLGAGDDCASFLSDTGYETLVTCDCMVEGRHYISGHITPFDLGSRAMVMNISDIAAMGGIPLYALVSLGLKKNTAIAYIEDMYRGFLNELNPLNAAVIGGNITGSGQLEFINITLIGKVESNKVLRRSGAKAGDVILVTGYPGQAATGLKILLENLDKSDVLKDPLVVAYNRPSHRAKEGREVALSGLATAMIDTSDGLLGDLGHICESSGVGAEIFRNKLPISQPMRNLINPQGWDIFETIVGDSDDYELIITCSPENMVRIKGVIAEVSNVPVTEIGIITGQEGIKIITPDGVRHPVRPAGWDHFKK